MGVTPHTAWVAKSRDSPAHQLAGGPDEALTLLINFMPLAQRTVQDDGLTIFHIRYWHPVFSVWREDRRHVRVRYHPEALSRVFASADGRNYVEARYADFRRPVITLWEQRAAVRALRAQNQPRVSEALVFQAIEHQRRIVERARRDTRQERRGGVAGASSMKTSSTGTSSPVNYDNAVEAFPLEIW